MRPIAALLLALLAACSGASSPVDSTPKPAARWAAVDRMMDSVPVRGAALLVMRGDSVLYERSTGGVDAGTPLAIASATKWISAATLMSLVDDGTLSLDDSVGAFFPGVEAAKRGITVRQLFSHTHGLDPDDPCLGDGGSTLAACAEKILATPLRSTPGTRFHYGGSGMQVAARMAEIRTGRPWTTLFRERVAGPLGLASTRYTSETNPRVAGGATSSARDYIRILRMEMNGGELDGRRVLSAQAVRTMEADQRRGAVIEYTPHKDDRGYGIGIWRDRVAADGTALQVSSQGAFGFSPWLDRDGKLVAVLAVQARLSDVYDFVERLQPVVREAGR